MASINLIRIDTRLVHGQICTKWSKAVNINKIIIADDDLVKDEFMSGIYIMAAPAKVKVQILSINDVIAGWNDNMLGDGRIMIILKNPKNAYELFSKGFPMEAINIGNLISSPNKISVAKNVFLDKDEFGYLKEINDSGTIVYVQNIPEHEKMKFVEIEKKFNN